MIEILYFFASQDCKRIHEGESGIWGDLQMLTTLDRGGETGNVQRIILKE